MWVVALAGGFLRKTIRIRGVWKKKGAKKVTDLRCVGKSMFPGQFFRHIGAPVHTHHELVRVHLRRVRRGTHEQNTHEHEAHEPRPVAPPT